MQHRIYLGNLSGFLLTGSVYSVLIDLSELFRTDRPGYSVCTPTPTWLYSQQPIELSYIAEARPDALVEYPGAAI